MRSRPLSWLYVVGGLLGFAAAAALTLEKLEKLANPDYVLTCSLNPIISCGTVMDSPQAEAFGNITYPWWGANGQNEIVGLRGPARGRDHPSLPRRRPNDIGDERT